MTEEITRAAEAPDFLVERDVGALLNTNAKALSAYRMQRAEVRKARENSERLDRLEAGFDEIKSLLLQVLNK